MRFRLPLLFALAPLAVATPIIPLEDPVARAALPEFQFIPAAAPASLAPAAPDLADLKTWPRSQGDNASRRYSALTQITRENIKDLALAWTFRAGDGAVRAGVERRWRRLGHGGRRGVFRRYC